MIRITARAAARARTKSLHDHTMHESIVDQNSVVVILGMRGAGACWILDIGRIYDVRTSMDSGRTPL